MSSPAPGTAQRARRPNAIRRQQLERERRRRRLALLVVLAAVATVILLLSAFGGSGKATEVAAVESPAQLLPAGPPRPEIVAKLGSLHLQLPVSQSRVTAVGYAEGSDGALALDPLGRQANEGLVKRLVHALVGGAASGPKWYQLAGQTSSSLDVGASAGTDAYSPVDGTVVAIDQVILNAKRYGSTIEIQPSGAPSLVVWVSHLKADPALVVGSTVSSGGTRLGQVLDFSRAERQALARYTNDAGNHVVIEVHPAETVGLP